MTEPGWYIGPTVFADVAPTHRVAQEEIFGPILAVMKAASFQEALALANSTAYALTGGVYSRSPPISNWHGSGSMWGISI